jgi:O-antigen/teichoic acid export membrane protein
LKNDNLREKAVSGAKWTGGGIAYTTVINLLTTAVLAHLLSPSDFGLMGMMTVVVGLISIFADVGVSNAIICHQDATREELSSLYWLNFLVGIGLFFIVFLLRPLAVAFFSEPRLSIYLPWLAVSFLVIPAGQQFGVLLRRELRFRVLTKINILSVSVSAAGAVAMALCGLGVWSLVFRAVVETAVSAVALLVVGLRTKWFPWLYPSLGVVKRYLSFGLFQMGERLLNYTYISAGHVIIGRLLGVEALGYYSLAYGLIGVPVSKINPIIAQVAFPTFARMQSDDEQLRRVYLKMLKYVSICSFPVMAGMFVVAPLLIPLVYGPKWLPAVPVFEILCVVGALRTLGHPTGSLLMAKGRADISFYWFIVAVFVMLSANIIGSRWGVVGVAWSIVLSTLVLWPGDFLLRWYLIKVGIIEYFNSLKIPATASGIMMICIWSTGFFWDKMDSMWRLAFEIILGAGVYFLLILLIAKPFWFEFKQTIFSRG